MRKDKKRICIVSTVLNPHTIRWAEVLNQKGYEVFIVSSDRSHEGLTDIEVIECIAKKSTNYFLKLMNQLLRAFNIRFILHQKRPDIVHIHSLDYVHPLMIWFVDLITKGFQPLIISTWGADIIGRENSAQYRRGRFAKKLLLRRAKEVTATTYFLAVETKKMIGREITVHVVPFGIDCYTFCPVDKSYRSSKIRIGFIKHLTPKYGPDYLLKAMPIVLKKYPDTELIMVGRGQMTSQLQELANKFGITNNVRFTGYIPNDKIPSILADIDIFVMPSKEDSETFGVAAVEAQAMQVPVIATRVGGVPEAVVDGKTAILVEPKNTEALAAAIVELIGDPEKRKVMGKEGRQFVLSNYNIEDNVILYEKLYQKYI